MSEAWYDPTPIIEAAAGAFDHASDEVVSEIGRRQKRITGRLAGSYGLSPLPGSDRIWWAGIVSSAPYAGAVERGAWSPGRGPHITRAHGNLVVKKTVQTLYGREMRAAMPAGYKARRTTVKARKVTLR